MWKDNEKIIEIYNKLNEGNMKFPCECPNCKSESAHIYFHKHTNKHCGVWVWCSECGAFAHMSSYAPSWWENPDFIDKNELCAEPQYLELRATDIDKWVNTLVPNKMSKAQESFIEDRFKVKFKVDIQGISSGTKGVLIVKNNLKMTSIQFVYDNGKVVNITISKEKLLEVIDVL